MRSHIYTLTYPEVLITEHQRWKQNSVHVRGSRSFCSLQAVGFSVVAFIFSCCESKTVNRTGTKAEKETEEALHPLLQTSKACIHKTDQSPPALYGHLLLPFQKWNDCFAIVMKRVHILLGRQHESSAPLLYTLLLEPSQLDFSAYGCDEQNCKCGKWLVSHFDITVYIWTTHETALFLLCK